MGIDAACFEFSWVWNQGSFLTTTTMTDHLSVLPHQVLKCICSFIPNVGGLVNLARTNKALSSYALQKIWHTLPSFVPFVYTLPSEAWTRKERAQSHTSPHHAQWILFVSTCSSETRRKSTLKYILKSIHTGPYTRPRR